MADLIKSARGQVDELLCLRDRNPARSFVLGDIPCSTGARDQPRMLLEELRQEGVLESCLMRSCDTAHSVAVALQERVGSVDESGLSANERLVGVAELEERSRATHVLPT